MKFLSSVLLFASVGVFNVAVGQGLGGLPSCATSCVNQLLNSGVCSAGDIKCICSNKTLISNASCCIAKHCTGKDAQKASNFADKTCQIVGITTLPQQASCPSTSAPQPSKSSTSTPASAATTKPPTTTNGNAAAKPTQAHGAGVVGMMGGAVIGLAGMFL